jgi:hypothetical protein
VDGRDKPGHDGSEMMPGLEFSAVSPLCGVALLPEELRGPAFQFPDLNIFDVVARNHWFPAESFTPPQRSP